MHKLGLGAVDEEVAQLILSFLPDCPPLDRVRATGCCKRFLRLRPSLPIQVLRLASCGERTVRLWDPTTGQQHCALGGHTNTVNCVVFSPDGLKLASWSRDKTVKLWDTTGKPCSAMLSCAH